MKLISIILKNMSNIKLFLINLVIIPNFPKYNNFLRLYVKLKFKAVLTEACLHVVR